MDKYTDNGHISHSSAMKLQECGLFVPTKWYIDCEKIFCAERKSLKHNGNMGMPTLLEVMDYLYEKLNITFDITYKQGIGIEVIIHHNASGTIETIGIHHGTELLRTIGESIDIAITHIYNKYKKVNNNE